jgi:hypothetical protein
MEGTIMRLHKLSVITTILAGVFVSGISSAAPFYDIPSLYSITFWESTNILSPKPYTFDARSNKLLTRLDGNMTNSYYDFWGVPSTELYDVFYSDKNGTFNPAGEYVTITAQFPAQAPYGGGLNICEMQLNFLGGITDHAHYVASFTALGDNASPASVANAIDGDIYTWTTLGNTFGQSQRLSLTLGYMAPQAAAVPIPPAIIMLGSGILGLIGFRNRVRNA